MRHTTFSRVAAAHQPNFFPWLGWFDKLFRADIFIILDDVQFPRGTGSWGNRVKIQQNGREKWLTASYDRGYHGFRKFNEMHLAVALPWRESCLAILHQAYRSSPWLDEVLTFLKPLLTNNDSNLVRYNMRALTALANLLGLDSGKFVFASQFGVNTKGTQRLVDLTREVGADAYLYGGGTGGYQDNACFERHGLGLVAQQFEHPRYQQFHQPEGFLPGLSVIDALFCQGLEDVGKFFAYDDGETCNA